MILQKILKLNFIDKLYYIVIQAKGAMMRETVTISLPQSVKRQLDAMVKRNHMNRSDIIREALRNHFAVSEFRELRKKMIPQAEISGIFTDEDVFEKVS